MNEYIGAVGCCASSTINPEQGLSLTNAHALCGGSCIVLDHRL